MCQTTINSVLFSLSLYCYFIKLKNLLLLCEIFLRKSIHPLLVRLLSPSELSHILVEIKLLRKKKKIVDEGGKFRLYNFKATSNISFLINICKFV